MVKSAPRAGGHKSSVVVREVTNDFINSGDVFILDTGKVLYQWNGKASSGIERVKAAEYAHGLEADRAGAVSVETFGEFLLQSVQTTEVEL
jgi:gelsolin